MLKASASLFTEHVDVLQSGRSVSDEHLAALWQKLRGALVGELRQRGLWTAPPVYLGIYGASSWTRDALDELMLECYGFAFLDRLRSLQAQLELHGNVEGLIFRNIRNFLHDTQRKHDPLGFRIFNLLRSAVLKALETGELYRLDGDTEVRNSTRLAFTDLPDLEEHEAGERAATMDRLQALVASWNDDLLPDLITALGKAQARVVSQLQERLKSLSVEGFAVFRFREVCKALKDDARRRWGTALEEEEGRVAVQAGEEDMRILVRQVQPATEVEDRDSFFKLLRCVSVGIDRLTQDELSDNYLRRLWTFLRCYAAEHSSVDGISRDRFSLDGRGAPPMNSGPDDKLPSHRKLARFLSIPRDRIASLHTTLQGLVEHCHGQFSNPRVTSEAGEDRGSMLAQGEPSVWPSRPGVSSSATDRSNVS